MCIRQLITDCDINYSDKDGWTPLHFSVDTGNIEMTNLLLSKSADPNYRTISGKNSPLHIAASKGFTDLVIFLNFHSHILS